MLKLAGDPALVNGSTADESWLFARAASGPASAEVKALVDLPAEVDLALSRVRRPDRVPGPRVGELLHTSRMRRLLQLLPSGGYVMSVRVPPRVHVVGLGKAATHVWDLLGDHEDLALVATEPWPPTDTEAVARSRGILAAGEVWPVVVAVFAAPESVVGHVLDGHHSLAAYLDVDVPPVVVCLVPTTPVPPRNEDVRTAVPIFVGSVPEHDWRATIRVLDDLRWLSLNQGSPRRGQTPGGTGGGTR